MARARTVARERARLQAKEVDDIRDRLAAELRARIAKVAAAVAPSNPFFWHTFRNRLAARETFRPLTDLEPARELAMQVLREDGHDLTGIVLRPFWQPPTLIFTPGPDQALALDATKEVLASPGGSDRHRRIAALGSAPKR